MEMIEFAKRWLTVEIANVFKWIATAVTLAGAICTALTIDPLNVILLNIGSALFLVWGVLIKDKAMILVNSGLLAIYAFGMFIRL
jgi:hypothetical protein